MERKKPDHTHELRLWNYRNDTDTQRGVTVELTGTYDECYAEVTRLAKADGVGAGLLLNNGGYGIVSLEEERKQRQREAGPIICSALDTEDVSRYLNNSDAIAEIIAHVNMWGLDNNYYKRQEGNRTFEEYNLNL